MKNLTWQNPGQLFVAQVLIKKVKLKCCGIKGFKIEDSQPLMLNNSQVVNPFNKYTLALKPLTAKKKKTEDDMNEIYRLQFESSLYMKGDTYIIPCDHFWKSVCTAAKEQKLGKKFEQSFQIMEDCILDFP